MTTDLYSKITYLTEAIRMTPPNDPEFIEAIEAIQGLVEVANRNLARVKVVHLNIRTRSGADYVYANWTDGVESNQKYVGKHIFASERKDMLENLSEPEPWHYILNESQIAKARKEGLYLDTTTRDVLGSKIDYVYNRSHYLRDLIKYKDPLRALTSEVGKRAHVVRYAGVSWLESMESDGWYISTRNLPK